jgi:hypothetical protein
MAVRLGEIMEELEQQDHAAGDELNPVPSWIRAHFVLEQEFEAINARQQELEAAMSNADNQRMQARSICAMCWAPRLLRACFVWVAHFSSQFIVLGGPAVQTASACTSCLMLGGLDKLTAGTVLSQPAASVVECNFYLHPVTSTCGHSRT